MLVFSVANGVATNPIALIWKELPNRPTANAFKKIFEFLILDQLREIRYSHFSF